MKSFLSLPKTHRKHMFTHLVHTLSDFFLNLITLLFIFCPASSAKVKFTASTTDYPDLPTWLRLEQHEPTEPAFLYGTPPADSPVTVDLEVCA